MQSRVHDAYLRMATFPQTFSQSPALCPVVLAPRTDEVAFATLAEADYRTVAFLDERVLNSGLPISRFPYPEVAQAVATANLQESSYWIFHTGHVGSTLLSRLLGEIPEIFSVREPAILRTLALAHIDRTLMPQQWTSARCFDAFTNFNKLWSRTFHRGQRSVIKTTSFVSALAGNILQRPFAPRAIFMFVSLETYLATILGAENSPNEARVLAPLRVARLNKLLDVEFSTQNMPLGEIVAMSWACEMLSLTTGAQNSGEQIFWLEFETFLSNPKSALMSCLQHFGMTASSDQIEAIVSGPIMSRYSKAQEFRYDRGLRNAVLNQARADHASEMKRGLKWFADSAAVLPRLEHALSRFVS